MLVYRVTQTKRNRGLYNNSSRQSCTINLWFQTFKPGTSPLMRFGSPSKEVALGFIKHALYIDRITPDTKLTLTVYEIPEEFCFVNPRLGSCEPHDHVEREVLFYPKKGRVKSRRCALAKEFVDECSSVG